MDTLEEKIYYKIKKCYEGFQNRQMGSTTKENEKQYFIDVTNAMTRIVKTEVNIRLQEEKHHPGKYPRELIKPGDPGYPKL
jgi:hypothetical protein